MHYLVHEFAVNSVSLSRIHYEFISFSQNYSKIIMIIVENSYYFLDTMVGYGYGYRPFKKSYGGLWLLGLKGSV